MDENLASKKSGSAGYQPASASEIRPELIVADEPGSLVPSAQTHSDDEGVKEAIHRFKKSQKTDSSKPGLKRDSSLSSTPMPTFPNPVKGLILTVVFSALALFFSQAPNGQLLIHLPTHLFWTAWLYRLAQIANRTYGSKTSPGLIALISIAAYLLAPLFPAPPVASRFLDPFFLAWAAAQFAATWTIGSLIEKGRTALGQVKDKQKWPLILTALGNSYILIGLLVSQILTSEVVFDLFWFICQFGWILYAKRLLDSDKSHAPGLEPAAELLEKSRKEMAFIEGGELELRYRSMAAVERWMAQRVSAKGMKQGLKLFLMWVCGPALVIGGVLFTRIVWFTTIATDSSRSILSNSAINADGGGSVQSFMSIFVTLSVLSIFTLLLWYRSKPTHILLSPSGLRFATRHPRATGRKLFPLLPWNELRHIGIDRPPGKTSTLHDRLVFEQNNGQKMRVKLDSLDSFEDKECILKAIKTWAPTINRDAAVLQCLQAPADYSYTELWLQALTAPPQRERLKPLVPETRLKQGKYVVSNSIGVGGQGQAYLAHDAISGDGIVLKEFILPVFVDISIRKSALEQFENEARILRQLDNPNIVKLLDYFVEDHRAYLVLEHIDGASLRKLVEADGALPEPQVRALAVQMCKILSYLHNLPNPVVHRDFTPDNLILNMDGTLKLIDFNVAQVQEESSTGTVVGKHAYLPPEQFRGMPCSQSDIYAMGATLQYLLTGADPEPISVSRPRSVNPAISEAMDKLVAKATAPNLKNRYPRVEDLKSEL